MGGSNIWSLIAQDGSLWAALPRMAWAEYGVGSQGQAKGVRLHLRFNIAKDCPEDALLTVGKGSETEALRQMLVPRQTNVADRLYGKSYRLFEVIDRVGAFFLFRLQDCAVIHWEEELPISPAAAQAGVVRHGWVHLGATEQLRSMRVRLVEVRCQGQPLLLVTNHALEDVSPELVALIYRRRWSIELYFRWIKCILGAALFFCRIAPGRGFADLPGAHRGLAAAIAHRPAADQTSDGAFAILFPGLGERRRTGAAHS